MVLGKPALLTCAALTAFAAVLPAGAASQPASKAGSGSAGVVTAQHESSKSMDRLQEAAQRVRDAIQKLAVAPPGDQRDAAMQSARKALLDTQQAMIDLPPELRTVHAKSVSDAEYRSAMDTLKQAAQRLRDSAHAMATQPAGQGRNQAIDEVNQALLEVNQAMVQVPWEPKLRTGTGSTSGSVQSGASGSAAGVGGAKASGPSDFDALDRNHDGTISRDEFARHVQR